MLANAEENVQFFIKRHQLLDDEHFLNINTCAQKKSQTKME